jgi:hypothetical protein
MKYVAIYEVHDKLEKKIRWYNYKVWWCDSLHRRPSSKTVITIHIWMVSVSLFVKVGFPFSESWMFVCLSVCLFVYLSACLFVCLSIYLLVYLSVCLPDCLSTWKGCFGKTNVVGKNKRLMVKNHFKK